MTDEQILIKNKKLLEQVRNEGEKTNDRHGNNGHGGEGYVAGGRSGDRQDAGRIAGIDQRNQGGTQGDARTTGIAEGRSEGVRQVDGTSINADQGIDSDGGRTQKRLSIVETPQEQADRERELTRQRVQRYRDRKKEALEADSVALRNDVKPGPQFHLKNPFNRGNAEKVRLFTGKEADDEAERMKDIYFRGSGLLDDVLEIIVKDHEPVQIWQLSQEEAETLSGMHLERAKKDESAARSARKLLEIYDRLYFWLLVGPRVKATGNHIAAHKGLGFR